MELGRLREVPLRQVWNHEALDLTPWLLANADTLLAEVLGIDLELSSSEHPVGAFAVDLVGRDQTHDCVLIVENQLTPTDHDHLGKLVTYAAGTDANTVVWIAPSFRDEHRQALDLLNDLAGERARFFGVELALVAIGDSPPAPLLRLRAQPNGWHAQIASAARAAAPSARAELYRQFWVSCLEQVHQRHPGWTRNRRPGATNWLQLPSPFRGESYYAFTFVAQRRVRVELYLDAAGDPTRVAALYTALHRHREEIEHTYGGSLNWEELPNRRASRVADYTNGDITDTASHDQLIDWLIEHGARLRAAVEQISHRILADLDER